MCKLFLSQRFLKPQSVNKNVYPSSGTLRLRYKLLLFGDSSSAHSESYIDKLSVLYRLFPLGERAETRTVGETIHGDTGVKNFFVDFKSNLFFV